MEKEKNKEKMEDVVDKQEEIISDELEDDENEVVYKDDVLAKEDKKEKKSRKEQELALLKEELGNKVLEIEEYKNKYLLGLAELQNYKKRMNDEMLKDRKYATLELCKRLLEVLDNLDRAMSVNIEDESIKSFVQGFEMIKSQLVETLKKEGVEEIESLDKAFDPNFHNAVMTEANPDKEEGIVVREFQKGYKFKDRVLRPAMVSVNKKE